MNIHNNVITQTLGRMCDFMILNLLWVVFSIPIVTIGASTCAMYSVMLKLVRNEEGYIARGFLKGFKDNFRQATILWMGILIAGAVVFVDFRIVGIFQWPLRFLFQALLIFALFILYCICIYAFPMIARYQNQLIKIVKNAVILAIIKLPYTFLVFIVALGMAGLTLASFLVSVLGLFYWILLGVSILFWVNSYILRKVFSVFDAENV